MNTCASCHAAIRWARTASGKAMPLDEAPHAGGNVVLDFAGRMATVLGPDAAAEAQRAGTLLYRSHHATCPDGARYRRARP